MTNSKEPTIINFTEMIANLQMNINSLAIYMNNPSGYVRNEVKDMIESHWAAIGNLQDMKKWEHESPDDSIN